MNTQLSTPFAHKCFEIYPIIKRRFQGGVLPNHAEFFTDVRWDFATPERGENLFAKVLSLCF